MWVVCEVGDWYGISWISDDIYVGVEFGDVKIFDELVYKSEDLVKFVLIIVVVNEEVKIDVSFVNWRIIWNYNFVYFL